MGGFTNPTIGDAFLAAHPLPQFSAEIEQLERELQQLKLAKESALGGQKDFAVARQIDTSLENLGRVLERHHLTYQLLLAADPTDPQMDRLRAAIQEVANRIQDVLAMGQPDRGKGSIAKIVQQHREKMLKTQKIVGSPTGPAQPGIQLPGLPGDIVPDPMLALAILLDLVRHYVLGKDKKK